MKRLIRKSYDENNLDVRDHVLKTTPCYPSFPDQHKDNGFFESDMKSYQRMMNAPVIERMEKEKDKN